MVGSQYMYMRSATKKILANILLFSRFSPFSKSVRVCMSVSIWNVCVVLMRDSSDVT